MGKVPFFKMHGLGNDFVVLDFRRGAMPFGAAAARRLANRRTGIGCDQIILLEPPCHPAAQVFMRIRNADGGEAFDESSRAGREAGIGGMRASSSGSSTTRRRTSPVTWCG